MKIFIVDDDVEQRMIMAEFLGTPENEVVEFADGAQMLANLDQAPDLILLDIEMPRLDGISACRQLREAGHEHIQVTFISGHDDMKTRLAAYAAGGSDFIVKPFMPADLLGKVEVARGLIKKQASFASDIQMARQTAFTAMSSMGELGIVLQFLRQSFACATPDALARLLMDTLKEYGLISAVALRTGKAPLNYASEGECTPLVVSILSHAQQMERIFRFRSQMSINYPRVTLVIMNLPGDEDLVGRLRDHLAILAEGTDARLAALEDELLRGTQTRAISEHVAALGQTIAEIDQQSKVHRAELLDLGHAYLEALTRMFAGLGLSEAQESALYRLAEENNARAAAVIDKSTATAAELRQLTDRLKTAL